MSNSLVLEVSAGSPGVAVRALWLASKPPVTRADTSCGVPAIRASARRALRLTQGHTSKWSSARQMDETMPPSRCRVSALYSRQTRVHTVHTVNIEVHRSGHSPCRRWAARCDGPCSRRRGPALLGAKGRFSGNSIPPDTLSSHHRADSSRRRIGLPRHPLRCDVGGKQDVQVRSVSTRSEPGRHHSALSACAPVPKPGRPVAAALEGNAPVAGPEVAAELGDISRNLVVVRLDLLIHLVDGLAIAVPRPVSIKARRGVFPDAAGRLVSHGQTAGTARGLHLHAPEVVGARAVADRIEGCLVNTVANLACCAWGLRIQLLGEPRHVDCGGFDSRPICSRDR